MLIGVDILGKESFNIDTGNKSATIRSCNNIVILLEVAPQAQMQFTQQILANKDTIIPTRILGQIPIQSKLPGRRTFLLKPSYAKPDITVFGQKVDCSMKKILMRNNTNRILVISGKTKLNRVVEYKADGCYRTHINAIGTALTNLQCLAICDLMAFNRMAKSNKTVLDNRTTCYGDSNTVNLLESKWMDIPPIAN